MSERILILLLLPILAIAGIYAVNASFEHAGADELIENESFDQPNGGDLIELEQSNRDSVFYNPAVVVKDENENVTVDGEDYIWHSTNGTLEILAGGDLDGDSNGTITYGYDTPTQEQRDGAEAWGKTQNAVVEPLVMVGAPLAIIFVVVGRLRG